MSFKPNRRFRLDYDHLFKINPEMANLFLLLCELSNSRGEILLGQDPEAELARLMLERFEDPAAYQLQGGRKR